MYPKYDTVDENEKPTSTTESNDYPNLNMVSIYGCPAPPNEVSPRIEPYKEQKPIEKFVPFDESIREALKNIQGQLLRSDVDLLFFVAEGKHSPIIGVSWTSLQAKSAEEAALAYAKLKQFSKKTDITVVSFGTSVSYFSVELAWKLTSY